MAGTERDRPLFVGGTGRSGTHAVAKLLGKHKQYHYVSRELRFHTDRGGIPDLLEGRIDVAKFLSNMRGYYWRRPGADGRPRGLHSRLRKRELEAALEAFEREYGDDPRSASANLVGTLVGAMSGDEGPKPHWIEQTPQTAAAAATLHEVFPEMKLVHMVRDGRDVAASIASQWWGPRSLRSGLKWWERRLRAADAGSAGLPEDRLLVIRLEDLVVHDRDGCYERLLAFLGVEDQRRVRKHFERRLTADNANIGRWRRGLSESRQRRVDRRYARVLERLARDGVRSAPPPESAA